MYNINKKIPLLFLLVSIVGAATTADKTSINLIMRDFFNCAYPGFFNGVVTVNDSVVQFVKQIHDNDQTLITALDTDNLKVMSTREIGYDG